MWMGLVLPSQSWWRAGCILSVYEEEWNPHHYWRKRGYNFPHQKIWHLWEAYADKENREDYRKRIRQFRSKDDWSDSSEEIAFCFHGDKRWIRADRVREIDYGPEPLNHLCRHVRIRIPQQLGFLSHRKEIRHLPLLRLESHHQTHESGAQVRMRHAFPHRYLQESQ